jgi:hypothetical protein
MFVVEWTKDGSTVHREAMLGASLEDIMKAALEDISKVTAEHRLAPDAVRIYDAARNTTTILQIKQSDA